MNARLAAAIDEFACHSAACAPPPVGRGGSLPNVGKGVMTRSARIARLARRQKAQRAILDGDRSEKAITEMRRARNAVQHRPDSKRVAEAKQRTGTGKVRRTKKAQAVRSANVRIARQQRKIDTRYDQD